MKLTSKGARTCRMLQRDYHHTGPRSRVSFNFLNLTILLLIQLSSIVFADNLSGLINIENNKFFLLSENSTKLEVKPLNQTTSLNLQRLNTGDFLMGTGEILNGNIVLQSIDFVGLKKLLGLWSSPTSWLNFESFSSVTVLFPNDIRPTSKSVTLQYSISPANQNTWRIFFSDEKSVALAILKLKEGTAEIQFLNSNTGEPSKLIELEKVAN